MGQRPAPSLSHAQCISVCLPGGLKHFKTNAGNHSRQRFRGKSPGGSRRRQCNSTPLRGQQHRREATSSAGGKARAGRTTFWRSENIPCSYIFSCTFSPCCRGRKACASCVSIECRRTCGNWRDAHPAPWQVNSSHSRTAACKTCEKCIL